MMRLFALVFFGICLAACQNIHLLETVKSQLQTRSGISQLYALLKSSGHLQPVYDKFCEHWDAPTLKRVKRYIGNNREKEVFLISRTCLGVLRKNRKIEGKDLFGLLGMVESKGELKDEYGNEIHSMFSYDPTGVWIRYFEPMDSDELKSPLYVEGPFFPIAFPHFFSMGNQTKAILNYVSRAFDEKELNTLEYGRKEEKEISFLVCALMALTLSLGDRELSPLTKSIRRWFENERNLFTGTIFRSIVQTSRFQIKENNPHTPSHQLLDYVLKVSEAEMEKRNIFIALPEPSEFSDQLSHHFLKALLAVANSDLIQNNYSIIKKDEILNKYVTDLKSLITTEEINKWNDSELYIFSSADLFDLAISFDVAERLMSLPPPPLLPLYNPLSKTPHFAEYFNRWIIRPYPEVNQVKSWLDLFKIMQVGKLQYFHSLPKILPSGARTDIIILEFIRLLQPSFKKIQINWTNRSINLIEDDTSSFYDLMFVRYLGYLFLHFPEYEIFEGFFDVSYRLDSIVLGPNEYENMAVMKEWHADLELCVIVLGAREESSLDWTYRRPFILSKYKIMNTEQ